MHDIQTVRRTTRSESGFVMLLVVMTSLAFSLFAAAQITETGGTLQASQFAERAMSRQDAHRAASVFCAEIGARHYAGGNTLTTNWSSDEVYQDTSLTISTVRNSLSIAVQNGQSTADSPASGSAARIKSGVSTTGTIKAYGQTWFIDPDYVGSYASSSGAAFFGGLTDCSGSGAGGFYCGGGGTIFTDTGEQVAATGNSSEYNLLPCHVQVQFNKYLKSDGSLDTTKPYQTYVVSYRHDYLSRNGDKL